VILGFSVVFLEKLHLTNAAGIRYVSGIKMIRDAMEQDFNLADIIIKIVQRRFQYSPLPFALCV